jgi:hypothetical protein
MKVEFSQQIFEKRLHVELHQNESSGSRVLPCGQTYIHTYLQPDGQDETNFRFTQFRERA